jgi:hypothetical protein
MEYLRFHTLLEQLDLAAMDRWSSTCAAPATRTAQCTWRVTAQRVTRAATPWCATA